MIEIGQHWKHKDNEQTYTVIDTNYLIRIPNTHTWERGVVYASYDIEDVTGHKFVRTNADFLNNFTFIIRSD